MSAPNEAGPQVGTERAQQEQAREDAAIIGHDDAERKAYATLAAQLALKGFSLYELACGGFLIARWDRSLHCSDLGCVRAFYDRLGA